MNKVFERALSHGGVVSNNYNVKSVKKTDAGFVINNSIKAKRVYSTIPLPELLETLDDIDIRHLTKFFDFNKVAVVAIALDKPAPRQHWVCVPDESIIFHRYAWLSNYSPYNAPPNKSLVIAEITIPRTSEVTKNITHDVIKGFERLNLLDEKDIIFVRAWIHEYGYPIHRINFSSVRDEVLSEIRKHVLTD